MLSPGCTDLEDYLEKNWRSSIFFFISYTVSFWCFRCAIKSNRMFEMMESTPISSISEVQSGATEIKGKVKAKEDILVSPWGRRKCVYYKFEVVQPKKGDNSSTTIIKDEKYIPFVVRDETGEVSVETRDAVFEMQLDKHNHSGMYKSHPPELKQLLHTRYGKSTEGLIFSKTLNYCETTLELDEDVYVFGTATRENSSRDRAYILQKGEMPLIITDKGGVSVELDFKKDGMTMMVIGGVTSGFALLGLILIVT